MSNASQQIGGVVINKIKSNIVSPKKVKGGSQYSSYLKFQKGGDNCSDRLQGGGSKKITIGRRKSAGGRIKPCKNGSNKKKKNEPGEIPILDVQFVKKEDKGDKKEVKKEEVKKAVKEDKRRSSQKRVSRVSRVSRGKRVSRVSRGKERVRGVRERVSRGKERVSRGKERVSRARANRVNRVSRGNRGTRNVRGRRGGGSLQKEKKGRKVSVSTSRTIGKKETQKMQMKIKEIQNKSSDDMIKELKKGGIEVSGKSKTILKDIYMYQQMCGINIKRE
tara:strand:+ start:5765 stop:6595 length:831 start_codon:yes stop_codon:yes gene_type:complete